MTDRATPAAPPSLYEIVRDACKAMGIGPRELADRCGLAREALDDITRQRRRTVAGWVYGVLSRETGIPRDELVEAWERFDRWLHGEAEPSCSTAENPQLNTTGIDSKARPPGRCVTCSFERVAGGAECVDCGARLGLRTA